MKLARRLTLWLLLGMSAVLVLSGTLRVKREIRLFESDMRHDQHLLGKVLGAAVTSVWEQEGELPARHLIARANAEEQDVLIRWVWLAAPPGSPDAPRLSPAALADAARGREVVRTEPRDGHGGHVYTYVPVDVPGNRAGALELGESLSMERRYVRTSIGSTVAVTAAMAAVSALLASWLGVHLVGRPLRELVAQARRVGSGDMSARVPVRHRDEIGELASEMNAMCEQIIAANQRAGEAAEARIAALEQLRHADRLNTVGKLASGIAHELGTPLNVISGHAKMIATGEVAGGEVADSARVVAQQAERMTVIIRQLLDFARRRGPERSPVEMRACAAQALAMLAPLAAKRGIEFELTAAEPELTARIDTAQIQQALTNLVVNGIHAMPRGGRLTVGVERGSAVPPADHGGPAGEYLRLWVEDQGVGMSEEVRAHVFEPFYTTKGVGEGTGLGLSVAYGIVREHGGWIAVDSELGRGSRFSIYLPLDTASAGAQVHVI